MNTLELEAYKAALAREVLNINNQEVLDTIKRYYTEKWKSDQCSLSDRCQRGPKTVAGLEKRFDEGEYVSEEEMEEFYNALQ